MKTLLLLCSVVALGLTRPVASPLATSASAIQAETAPLQPSARNDAPPTVARPPYISPGAAEVVKMTRAGLEPALIKEFVENSPSAYAPGAAEIIYLRDEGVPSEIITALIKRGSVLRVQAMESARANQARNAAQPATPTVIAAPQPVVVTQPVQTVAQPVYVYQSPAYVSYPYPNYYNNYYYGSPFAFRVGFYPRFSTWGNHYHHHHVGHGWGAPYRPGFGRPGFGAHFAGGSVRVGGSFHRR